ncbi:putative Integral membrane sensor signal transduction histidine kinase [Candidatus Sulfopaludibacter sp. SbA4]|nr:putative Integral membrane sensor signal transduction histidine kinase [Candidatus Sulfopaludibacter sp. SbA4]
MRFWSMSPERSRPRTLLSWLFVGALFVLCGVLGIFQYRLIGEVSDAARERLRGSLRASLNRFSSDFNSELSTAARAILPVNPADAREVEAALPARYEQWKTAARHHQVFRRIAIAIPQESALVLRTFDLNTGAIEAADWPESWSLLKHRLEGMVWPEDRGWRPPGPPPERDALVFEVPVFGSPRPGPPRPPFSRREIAWVLFEANTAYVRETLLPEMLQRDLADYQVAVVTKTNPPQVIYESDPDDARKISGSADASVSFFDVQVDSRQPGPPNRGRGPGGSGPGFGPAPGSGRWQMFVRNRAGSLEAVVARARRLNLALTTGVLLLLLASVAALIRFTQRAQKLAELQMGFVAGVSHELRTPLAVIHTAGYNLQGKMAQNPVQVERYGALIQKESGRLKDLVEQVLRFAGAEAGRVIHEPEPLSVESVIDDTMESSKAVMDESHCVIEKAIEPGLPLILGDPMALKHALQNLLSNAAKYGAKGGNWIGIFASKATDHGRTMVEIRVADRGPGIPADEQAQIFDPFFRGQRAVQDQVHGTGLGLNLVKKIVEAHGGTIRVKSEPMKGAEFIVRIPEAAGVSG